MKIAIAMLVLAACAHAPMHNVAEDTVHFVEPTARCEGAFESTGLHSTRCELSDHSKLYCTASATGFICGSLTAAPATAAKPAAPPATPSKATP